MGVLGCWLAQVAVYRGPKSRITGRVLVVVVVVVVVVWPYCLRCCDLQCFDTFGLASRKSVRPVKNLSDEALMWLSVWSEGQIVNIWSS